MTNSRTRSRRHIVAHRRFEMREYHGSIPAWPERRVFGTLLDLKFFVWIYRHANPRCPAARRRRRNDFADWPAARAMPAKVRRKWIRRKLLHSQ